MKKKVFLSLLFIVGLFTIVGCGKIEEKGRTIKLEKGKFSIICDVGDAIENDGIDQATETTYNFNDEQYVINYAVVTTQKFKDKSVYKTYKEAQEETVSNSSKEVAYSLKSDDAKKTLVFTMAISKVDVNDAQTEEEKERLKAISILNNEQSTEVERTCKIKGIKRSELK